MDGAVTAHSYRTIDVPVAGGDLRVGVWDPSGAGDDPPTVLLVHGVTASHLSWPAVVERLPGIRAIAPDLRGRGRSNEVGGATGLAAHAQDLADVVDAVGVDPVVVVGHSMGAFVSLVFAHRHPERVSGVVLVDGGLPLDLPAELSDDEVIRLVLGPTAERLRMRFATVGDYLDFWREHPAFARDWSPMLEAYLAYDLVGEEPELRPSTRYATLEADSVDQNGGAAIATALDDLRHPVTLVTAERGLLDQTPGLYADERLRTLLAEHPGIRHLAVPDVNHYTVVLSDRGADAVAEVIRDEVAAAPHG